MNARNGFVIVLTNCAEELDKNKINYLIELPSKGNLTSLLATIALQLLTLNLCFLMNKDPDRPRNLAKTVTV